MKAFIVSWFALILSLAQTSYAQNVKQWELGISASTGRNYYDKKYYGQSTLAPGWETKFKSDYIWSVGVRAEKRITSRLSAITALQYAEEGVPQNMFCECNSISESTYDDEKLHRVTYDAGLRYYVNPSSKAMFFLEGKANLDWLLGVQETVYRFASNETSRIMHWNAFGYHRFSPNVAFLVGVKWKRLSIDFGGVANVARSTIRNAGTYDRIVHPIKTGFFSQGIYIKTAVTLFKSK